jgi:ribonuclease-3
MAFLLKRFGYKPKNLLLFIQALTHKSSLSNPNSEDSNERLEFLGDAVLDAVIAEYLFTKFPKEDEGYLTKIKSKIVNRKNLSDIGNEMKIREVLVYNETRAINLNSLEGNAFEAIIGAIYLDGGFEKARQTINNYVIRKYINLTKLLEEEIDFKSKLFIWCQKRKLTIEFSVMSESHENGQWTYKVKAIINNVAYGIGTGQSKKAAEQEAARETFQLMGEI